MTADNETLYSPDRRRAFEAWLKSGRPLQLDVLKQFPLKLFDTFKVRSSALERVIFQKTYPRILAFTEDGQLVSFKHDFHLCTLKWQRQAQSIQQLYVLKKLVKNVEYIQIEMVFFPANGEQFEETHLFEEKEGREFIDTMDQCRKGKRVIKPVEPGLSPSPSSSDPIRRFTEKHADVASTPSSPAPTKPTPLPTTPAVPPAPVPVLAPAPVPALAPPPAPTSAAPSAPTPQPVVADPMAQLIDLATNMQPEQFASSVQPAVVDPFALQDTLAPSAFQTAVSNPFAAAPANSGYPPQRDPFALHQLDDALPAPPSDPFAAPPGQQDPFAGFLRQN